MDNLENSKPLVLTVIGRTKKNLGKFKIVENNSKEKRH